MKQHYLTDSLITRGIAYFTIPTILFAITALLAGRFSAEHVVREGGFIEQFQCGVLAICVGVLLSYCWWFPKQRAFLILSATLGSLALIREANNSAWYAKVFCFPCASSIFGLAVLSMVLWRFRDGLLEQVAQLRTRVSTLFFAAGSIIVVGWAQILTQRSLFPDRLADRALEESLEAAGYLLILSGVVELYFDLKRVPAASQDRVPMPASPSPAYRSQPQKQPGAVLIPQ
ncbi:MAG TPA: hypothetical protein VEC99_08355 [Clostridia bacterium]|nr:hypothetical protein [Clostridia bacterium]